MIFLLLLAILKGEIVDFRPIDNSAPSRVITELPHADAK